jgi:kumamolisin
MMMFTLAMAAMLVAPKQPVVADVPRVAYRDMGVASSNTPMDVAIVLNYRRPEQLDQLIELQSDPASPYYQHWLTPQQFAASFGPTESDYARIVASLRRAGFTVTGTFSNRTVLDARASSALVSRYFNTRIDRVYQAGHGLRYANVAPVSVPADVRGLVYSVSGLQNLALVHTHFVPVGSRRPAVAQPPLAASAAHLFGPVSSASGLYGYGPVALAMGYDAPIVHRSSNDGKGRSEGIVIDADYSDADLDGFLRYFGVKRTGPPTTRVAVDGGPDKRYVDSDATEATLDTETIVGISPGVKLTLYEMPQFAAATDPEKEITDAYDLVVSDNAVDAVNSSFGACESAEASDSKAWDHIAAQGTALGITFHASTGDFGSFQCSSGGGVAAPASSSHFVAVGGTTLLVSGAGAYQGEAGWVDSGGGFSVEFGLPSYQRGIKNVKSFGRNLPDVSFDADPTTGLALFYGGTWNNAEDPIGGTSLSSPIFGALLDQIEQQGGKRLGMVQVSLFKLAKIGYSLDNSVIFHDQLVGSNGLYVAVPGYDNVTGIGSFDTSNLARQMEKR